MLGYERASWCGYSIVLGLVNTENAVLLSEFMEEDVGKRYRWIVGVVVHFYQGCRSPPVSPEGTVRIPLPQHHVTKPAAGGGRKRAFSTPR